MFLKNHHSNRDVGLVYRVASLKSLYYDIKQEDSKEIKDRTAISSLIYVRLKH